MLTLYNCFVAFVTKPVNIKFFFADAGRSFAAHRLTAAAATTMPVATQSPQPKPASRRAVNTALLPPAWCTTVPAEATSALQSVDPAGATTCARIIHGQSTWKNFKKTPPVPASRTGNRSARVWQDVRPFSSATYRKAFGITLIMHKVRPVKFSILFY